MKVHHLCANNSSKANKKEETERGSKMNRNQRRLMKRKNELIASEIRRDILRQTEQQLNDGRVEAMMLCFTLAMHRELGFEKDQCMKILQAVDSLMAPWIKNECDLETMSQWAFDEVGIEIQY